MVKLKKQGCPMDSVESAQAWRQERQNIAARKPLPGANVNQATAYPRPPAPLHIVAREVREDGSDLDESHDGARTRREIAEANLAEIREAELRGELIRVASVKTTLATVFATTRDALLQIPPRLAPLLAADSDPASVQTALHAEIHQALQNLAGASDRLGQKDSVPE